MKQDLTLKCADFVCHNLHPFETVAGDGFVALAQALTYISRCSTAIPDSVVSSGEKTWLTT